VLPATATVICQAFLSLLFNAIVSLVSLIASALAAPTVSSSVVTL